MTGAFSLLNQLIRFRRNALLSRSGLLALQQRRLQALLEYAWDHSPYYRTAFARAGIRRDELSRRPLSAFPTMDKASLMENFDSILTVPDVRQADLRRFDAETDLSRKPYLGRYHIVHSSGSTGQPGYFLYDEAAWRQMLLGIIRGALWGMRLPQILALLAKRPRILYIAATDGRYGGAMAVGDGIDGVGASQLYLDIKTPLDRWVESVQTFRPHVIIGYPSAIKILADLVEEGRVSVRSERVVSCGEPLPAGLRNFLEKTFRCPVINLYGASESLALGVETGREDGMLLFDDLNVIEVEKDGIYLTCLYNYAQPLIRYRLSDRLVCKAPLADSPFSRAEILLGRQEDLLWFSDGQGHRDFLHPLAIEGFCLPGLRDYQFRQTAPDAFEMLAEVAASADRKEIRAVMVQQMHEILEQKNLGFVGFTVRFVSGILPDPATGKKSLIAPSIIPAAPGKTTPCEWEKAI